jgi:hypothetical protein
VTRQEKYLARKARGRVVLGPECDRSGIADMLYAEGYLDDWRVTERRILSAALGAYLDDVLRVTGHATNGCYGDLEKGESP